MKVITVATKKLGYYSALEESACKLGYELILLGFEHEWKGFGWRIRMIMEYLETLPKDEIFMMVDAYDVVLLQNASIAQRKFKKMNKKFICGAFRSLKGISGYFQDLEFGKPTSDKTFYTYNRLCCGTWMSRAGDAIDIWENSINSDNVDDQMILNSLYSKYNDENIIYPDYNQNIFLTLCPNLITNEFNFDEDKIIIKKNKIFSVNTNSYPIAIHGIGNGNLSLLLKELGFQNYDDKSPRIYFYKKVMYHAKMIIGKIMSSRFIKITLMTIVLIFMTIFESKIIQKLK